jgi:hypothetical protein
MFALRAFRSAPHNSSLFSMKTMNNYTGKTAETEADEEDYYIERIHIAG